MAPFDEVGVLTFRVALTVDPELQIGQKISRCAPRVQELYKRGQETQRETQRDTERHRETQRDTERERETQRDTERHRETHYVM